MREDPDSTSTTPTKARPKTYCSGLTSTSQCRSDLLTHRRRTWSAAGPPGLRAPLKHRLIQCQGRRAVRTTSLAQASAWLESTRERSTWPGPASNRTSPFPFGDGRRPSAQCPAPIDTVSAESSCQPGSKRAVYRWGWRPTAATSAGCKKGDVLSCEHLRGVGRRSTARGRPTAVRRRRRELQDRWRVDVVQIEQASWLGRDD